jgi:hypothetical protein
MASAAPSEIELEDRRKSPREEVDEPAYISGDGSSTRCRVVNASTEGVAIEVPNAAYIPPQFKLMTERDRVIRTCRVIWMMKNRIGVAFTD